MMSNILLKFNIIIISVFLFGCVENGSIGNNRNSERIIADKKKVDAFFDSSFKAFDRSMQPLAKYEGKVMVAYFWATWCASCVRETTMLKELEEQYRDKNVSFLGIAVDNTDKVENFVKKNGITFEILIGGNDAIDLSKQMGNLRKGLPYMVVIDADNNFIAKFLGETSKEKLEEAIVKAIL